MQRSLAKLSVLLMIFVFGRFAQAATPFRLLTMEAASNPESSAIIGLQEAGFRFGHLLVESNPLFDALLVANIGAKYAAEVAPGLRAAAGVRYVQFVGSSVAESLLQKKDSRIRQFSIDFRGPTAFAAASVDEGALASHVNVQFANVSNSRVFNLVGAETWSFAPNWNLIGEAGYDFANSQPRLSAGVSRDGDSFGFRAGVTYVRINDAYFNYSGVAPTLDFYWLIGSAQ